MFHKDSPFIRKPTKKTSSESIGGGSAAATPLPDQEVPFFSSFRRKTDGPQFKNTSSAAALDNFMKFDERYAAKYLKGD